MGLRAVREEASGEKQLSEGWEEEAGAEAETERGVFPEMRTPGGIEKCAGRIAVRSAEVERGSYDGGHHRGWTRAGHASFQTGFSSVSYFPSLVCSRGCLLLQVGVSFTDLQG